MLLLTANDDIGHAVHLSHALRDKGFEVEVAYDGRDALLRLREHRHSALLLKRELPIFDGISVLRKLRNGQCSIPIVMMGVAGEADIVACLDAGADDCCRESTGINELNARLHAVMRRPPFIANLPILRVGSLEVNPVLRKVTRRGVTVLLLPLEMEVLLALIRNSHRVTTREMLVNEVWGLDFLPTSNVVEAKITRLRTKLNFGGLSDIIVTVRGSGYILSDDA